MVHCASRYAIVACGLSPLHWAHLSEFVMEQIRQGFLDAGVPETTVEQYFQAVGTAEFTRTHGRREVAFLNRAWEDVLSLDFTVDPDSIRQPLLERAVNALPCRCAGFDGQNTASAFLHHAMSQIPL